MIRPARPGDEADLLRLVRGLARYEREPGAVVATEASLAAALFGPAPRVFAHVAVEEVGADEGAPVGMAVWFLAFSTWTGRPTLYLEDLFVEPERRGSGLGRELMAALAGRAGELGRARMDWSVLDWNQPAIGFYRSLGAYPLDGWTTWRLEGAGLARLAGQLGPEPG